MDRYCLGGFHYFVFQTEDTFFCAIQSAVDCLQCIFQLLFSSVLISSLLQFVTFC